MEDTKTKIIENNYCTIYIVRHGQTNWNVEGRTQGHLDSLLTEKGRNQARAIAKQLRSIHFDVVFSSDLQRAKETAQVIASGREIEFKLSQALRERNFGRLQGLTRQERDADQNLRAALEHHYRLTGDERWDRKPFEDFESNQEVATRFINELRAIAVAYPAKTILVVSHGDPMRLLLAHLGEVSKDYDASHRFTNTGYVKLRSDGVDFWVDEVIGLEPRN